MVGDRGAGQIPAVHGADPARMVSPLRDRRAVANRRCGEVPRGQSHTLHARYKVWGPHITHNEPMNFASALKAEIARVARKEVRTEVVALKKSVAVHRSDIAALKRQITELKKQNRQFANGTRRSSIATPASEEQVPGDLRFRPQGLASHRQRLGLSAQAMGRLLGVSGQSVTAWETGKTAPRRSQLPAIAEVRKLGKREAAARLSRA